MCKFQSNRLHSFKLQVTNLLIKTNYTIYIVKRSIEQWIARPEFSVMKINNNIFTLHFYFTKMFKKEKFIGICDGKWKE